MTPQSFDGTTGCSTATITATSSPATQRANRDGDRGRHPIHTSSASSGTHTSSDGHAFSTVTSVTPTSGSTAGGTSVTITGTNFTGATAVRFGTTSATTFTVGSDTSITATSPAGTAGTVNVTVTTPSATSATSAGDLFTYATVPGAPTKFRPPRETPRPRSPGRPRLRTAVLLSLVTSSSPREALLSKLAT